MYFNVYGLNYPYYHPIGMKFTKVDSLKDLIGKIYTINIFLRTKLDFL